MANTPSDSKIPTAQAPQQVSAPIPAQQPTPQRPAEKPEPMSPEALAGLNS